MSTPNVAVEPDFELERFWRRLRPQLRITPRLEREGDEPPVDEGRHPQLPAVPSLAEPILPVEDLYLSGRYLASLPTRPLDYARRTRFERHVGIFGRPLPAAEQVLFPRSVRLRAFGHPASFVFGRPGVDPAILNPVPSLAAWQLRHLHLHLTALWRGAATLPQTLGSWSPHAAVIVALRRGNAPVYHAAIGFRAPMGVPQAWYSWVPASRPFVARHSIDALLGGCPYHGAPVVGVYVVTTA